MTLMNGLMYQGKAYLWVDTAVWDPTTGERIGDAEKAFVGNLWPWAAVHTGHIDPSDLNKVARRMAERPNLTSEGLIRDAIEVLRIEAREGRLGRLLLAYPCPEYGARMTIISNRDFLPVAKAYEPHDVGEYLCSGNGADWAKSFHGRDLTPEDVRNFIRIQARHSFDTEDGWRGQGIGGDIYEIEVSPHGVRAEFIWNSEGHYPIKANQHLEKGAGGNRL